MTKVCRRCGTTKETAAFNKHSQMGDGYLNICKACNTAAAKAFRVANVDRVRAQKAAINKRYNDANRHTKQAHQKEYYATVKDAPEYKAKHTLWNTRYDKSRKNEDPCYKLRLALRSRTSMAVSGRVKAGSAVADLGCTIEELRTHIEALFADGMRWDNYGHRGWHVDHVVPLVAFDLSDREQFLKACHYTNLQPLWWHENLAKGAKLHAAAPS